MDRITKHWITSVVGLIFVMFGGYLIFEQYPEKYIYITFGIGALAFFMKDTWADRIFNKRFPK